VKSRKIVHETPPNRELATDMIFGPTNGSPTAKNIVVVVGAVVVIRFSKY